MAGNVLERAVQLTVLSLGERLDDAGPASPSQLELGVDVGHAYPDHVGHDTALWRLTVTPDIGHDHRAVIADTELRSVALAYPRPLDKAKRLRQPRNRSAHIRVHEYRNDGCGWDRTVALHLLILLRSLGDLGRCRSLGRPASTTAGQPG